MSAPDGMKCPFNKMKPCIKDECAMYVRMNGTDPNSGEQVNKGACSLAWLPTLHLEGNQMVREQGAATESLRNKIDESNKVNGQVVSGIKQLLIKLGEFITVKRIEG